MIRPFASLVTGMSFIDDDDELLQLHQIIIKIHSRLFFTIEKTVQPFLVC